MITDSTTTALYMLYRRRGVCQLALSLIHKYRHSKDNEQQPIVLIAVVDPDKTDNRFQIETGLPFAEEAFTNELDYIEQKILQHGGTLEPEEPR